MLALLLTYGAKLLARPALLVGLTSALTIGWLQWSHSREVGRLEKDIAAITAQRDTEARQKLEFKAALSDVTASRDHLAAEVRRQNDAIGAMQRAAEQRATEASLAAVRAFNQGRASAEALRQPTTTVAPGHDAMNEWLKARVAQ